MRYIVGSSSCQVKPKAIQLVCVASPLSTQHYMYEARTRTGWHGNTMMFLSGATCVPKNCFNGLAYKKIQLSVFGLVQSGHRHLINT